MSSATDHLIDNPALFDNIPASLWLEDYSQLYRLFEQWRADGVLDIRTHLLSDPGHLRACSDSIRLLRVNQRTLALYEADSFDTLASNLHRVLRNDTYDAFIGELEQLWLGHTAFESKTVNYTLSGRRMDILLRARLTAMHAQPWDRVLVVLEDISELEDHRRRLAESERYARSVFQLAPVSLWVQDFTTIHSLLHELRERGIQDFRTFTDVHPEFVERCAAEIQVLDVNQGTLNLFQASNLATLVGRLPDVFRDDMLLTFRDQLLDLWEGRLLQQREVVYYALNGEPIYLHMQMSVLPGHEHDWSMVLLALTDISARKKAEAYLEYLGKHDALTKLKNRAFYTEELNRIRKKGPFPVSIIMVDLNDLKIVNDQLGHSAGDGLLQRAGEILAKALDNPHQHAARIGGDEFVMLLTGTDADEARVLADNIRELQELNNQFYTGPKLQFALGMATCPAPAQLDDALKQADLDMYRDKQHYQAAKQ